MLKLVLLLLVVSGYTVSAQSQIQVKKLGASVNSEAEETLPLLDALHNRLYFSRILHPDNKGGKYSGADIWYLDLNSETEGPDKSAVDNLNDKKNNFIVGINSAEDILYLNNPKSAEKGFQFSKSHSNKWISPESIEIPGLPLLGYRGLYVSPDYQEIILSMEGEDSQGEEDLYLSHRNNSGEWTKPINLGVTINTKGKEISPFLSADKRKLYFASDGHGGQGGMDIFEVERLYDSWTVWGNLKNLGSTINSEKFDAYYSVYGDSIAFFASNRDSEYADVYKVSYRLQKKIEQQSIQFVPITNTSSRNQRNYLSATTLKEEYQITSSLNIPIYDAKNISNNELINAQIYLVALKLKENPDLKLAIHFEPSPTLERSEIVAESSQIILSVYKKLMELNIKKEQLFFDGIVNKGELAFYGSTAKYLLGLNLFK